MVGVGEMAVRVGIDLVRVSTVAQAVRDHGERYLRRIYTDGELHDCHAAVSDTLDGVATERLAARFAAKEAALKVLRPAGDAIPWRDIELVRQPAGWVELRLAGRAAAAAVAQGLDDFAVSISHEHDYATAVVAAECGPKKMRTASR